MIDRCWIVDRQGNLTSRGADTHNPNTILTTCLQIPLGIPLSADFLRNYWCVHPSVTQICQVTQIFSRFRQWERISMPVCYIVADHQSQSHSSDRSAGACSQHSSNPYAYHCPQPVSLMLTGLWTITKCPSTPQVHQGPGVHPQVAKTNKCSPYYFEFSASPASPSLRNACKPNKFALFSQKSIQNMA